MNRAPFPLSWPDGWVRTKRRIHSNFSVPLHTAVAQIQRELRLLGGARVVLTSNLPVSNKGIPYAAARADGGDPGIAVWWVQTTIGGSVPREMVMACDTYRTPAENMRSIGCTLQALRSIKRWAATSVVDRAFAGFAALPPGSGETVGATKEQRPWREVFIVGDELEAIEPVDLYAIIKGRHQKLALVAHPDRGGSAEDLMEINTALDEARKELGIE